jgi:hypothetical protein
LLEKLSPLLAHASIPNASPVITAKLRWNAWLSTRNQTPSGMNDSQILRRAKMLIPCDSTATLTSMNYSVQDAKAARRLLKAKWSWLAALNGMSATSFVLNVVTYVPSPTLSTFPS